MRISEHSLRCLAIELLQRSGAPALSAELQADLLIEAELRGLPSHGLQRLPRLLARIDRGLVNPVATGQHRWLKHGYLDVDGQRALGPVALMGALEALVPKARNVGLGVAAIRNSNHSGMMAYYVEQAALQGLICIVVTTSEALVHPFGGTRAMLGTNPIAIGIPTGDAPFVLDMATSIVSMGKIHNHALRNEALQPGWAVDEQGRSTSDAEAAKSGALAPFWAAKGYGLGLAVELLVAALAGSEFAPEIAGTLDDTEPANKGDVLILIDPASRDGTGEKLTRYLDMLRACPPADPVHPVAIPGDRMRARRSASLRDGIELPCSLLNELRNLQAA
ncbi:Ldh family oxidoreductase [Roseinatronobacter sp.]